VSVSIAEIIGLVLFKETYTVYYEIDGRKYILWASEESLNVKVGGTYIYRRA
jgi:hypothetical protein